MKNKTDNNDGPAFVLQINELASFDLCGWKQLNGVIKLNSGRFIRKWPEEIYFMGGMFVLEEIELGKINQETGAVFECAMYL